MPTLLAPLRSLSHSGGMHGNASARRLNVDQQQSSDGGTAVSRIDAPPSLVDVTRVPLSALAELDDLLLAATMQRLLPSFAAIRNRLWNQNTNGGDG